jgi:glycosyltransferase involved in cell wall biosynthesis
VRILHTVGLYWPHVGGAELVVQRISEGLAHRGHDVTVATAGRGRCTESHHGVTIERFPITGCEAAGIRGPALAYASFLREGRFDVMLNYAAQSWPTDIALDLLPSLGYARVLAPCGYSGLHWPAFEKYFDRLPRRLVNYDMLIYHSSRYRDAEFGRRHGLGHELVIPNAADDLLDPALEATDVRAELGIPPTAPLLLTVGSHYRAKGHDVVRGAFAFIRRERPDVHLVIVGPRPASLGEARRGCYPSCLAAAWRSRHVHLVDGADRRAVVGAYRAATLFLLGSRVECSPLVVLEAMAAGVPWVSSRVGNVDELPGGIVVDSAEAIGRAAVQLLRSPQNRGTTGEEGRAAWESRHRWPAVVDLYERLYSEVAGA